jgi:hypothetical protein
MECHASQGVVEMNKKMPVALAIAMLAVTSAWAPRGWSQAGSSLPPQLQTDAQRGAARAARAAASAAAGGAAQPSNAAGGDTVATALGAAVLADVVDAAAASAHNAAMRPPRGPDPVADWRGGVDPDASSDDPLGPARGSGPQ